MLDVVIIDNYWHFPSEKSSSRQHYIACCSVDAGFSTEIITSRFYHTQKKRHDVSSIDVPYKVTMLEEGTYKKNVSVFRILAHTRFAINVIKYLSKRKRPDVIYLFVPPTGLAKKVTKFANKHNIRVVIDIQDLWPEAFNMVLPAGIAKPLLLPMKRSVEYAYRNADEVIAVSQTYVKRAMQHNCKCSGGHSVFIGADLKAFDAAAENAPPLDGKLRPVTMAYIGMLGHSYDLCGVMDAMALLREQGHDDAELLIMGDGPLREKFEQHARRMQVPVRFTGRLSYEDMVKKLVKCDIGINVLVGNAAQSIINKHGDYVAAGIPVINVQKHKEFGQLLEAYGAGVMCAPGDTSALAKKIQGLVADENLRRQMGKNSRRLAEERFDRNQTYYEIIQVIKGEEK